MIERIAKAIYEKRNGAGCVPWSRRPPAHRDPYMADARAAIEAMREPNEAMDRAGLRENTIQGAAIWATPAWQAMVAAALSPAGEK